MARGLTYEEIIALQHKLSAIGVFHANPDVVDPTGESLASGVRDFQSLYAKKYGLKEPTGEADHNTLSAVNQEVLTQLNALQPGQGQAQGTLEQPPLASPPLNRVGMLQQRLQQLGQYDGPINGELADTRTAIEKYQRAHRLPVTGRPNPATENAVDAELAGNLAKARNQARNIDAAAEKEQVIDKSLAPEKAAEKNAELAIAAKYHALDHPVADINQQARNLLPLLTFPNGSRPASVFDFQNRYNDNAGVYGPHSDKLINTGVADSATLQAMQRIAGDKRAKELAGAQRPVTQHDQALRGQYYTPPSADAPQVSPEVRAALKKIGDTLGISADFLGKMITQEPDGRINVSPSATPAAPAPAPGTAPLTK